MTSSNMNPDAPDVLTQREHLSAGIDGELDRDQQRFLLRRFEHDAALQGVWLRYQLIGDGLRRDFPVLASAGFSERVMEAINEHAVDSHVVPVRQSRGGRWLKFSAGTAIAASVAVAALVVTRPVDNASAPLPRAAAGQLIADAPVTEPAMSQSAPVTAPAVPTWLSRNNAFAYSQQASATITGPSGSFASESPYARSLSPYQLNQTRSATQPDGSYLLLVDPTHPATQRRESQRVGAPVH